MSTTGNLVERARFELGSMGSFDQIMTADFDGVTRNFQGLNEFAASSPEMERTLTGGTGPSVADLTFETLRVTDTLYMTMRGWPPKLRGRWLRVSMAELAQASAGQGVELTGNWPTPSKLLTAVDSADRTVSRTAMTYRLTMPAEHAVSAPGNHMLRMLSKREIDPAQLEGSVPLHLTVDPQGRVEHIALDASEVVRQIAKLSGTVGVPDDLRITVDLRMRNYGKPVSVQAPPPDKLIDSAELNR